MLGLGLRGSMDRMVGISLDGEGKREKEERGDRERERGIRER